MFISTKRISISTGRYPARVYMHNNSLS